MMKEERNPMRAGEPDSGGLMSSTGAYLGEPMDITMPSHVVIADTPQLSRAQKMSRIYKISTVVLFAAFVAVCIGWILDAKSCDRCSEDAGVASTPSGGGTLVLVSIDGFRWDYIHKGVSPNLDQLRKQGVQTSMIPVFPSKTFPNHYSIATGLYPAYHGIIANDFVDPDDGSEFHINVTNPKFWGGEPIWVTAKKQGLIVAPDMWPGNAVPLPDWTCQPSTCTVYNASISPTARVDRALSLLARPSNQRPRLVTVYLESVDWQGHRHGPDSPQVADAIATVDAAIGRLVAGLEQLGGLRKYSLMIVGDHGMAGVCASKLVYLEDFYPALAQEATFSSNSPMLFIFPKEPSQAATIYSTMSAAMANAAAAANDTHVGFTLMLKESSPERLHLAASRLVGPIIVLADEGYTVLVSHNQSASWLTCGGSHGFDNQLLSMRTIFLGAGKYFTQKSAGGTRSATPLPPFENVNLYSAMARILGLDPAPNNGSQKMVDLLLGVTTSLD